MKKTVLFFGFLFAAQLLFGQVGIGTVTPDASSILDISAGDKGILIPQVSLANVTDTSLDGTNTAATGLLIYNTNASVIGGSGEGYYYYTGTGWEKLVTSAAATSDIDWYEEGTTTSPNNIGDDKYTFGNLAIGKNTADYRLELWQTDNTVTRTLNIYSDYAGAGVNSNIFNENNFTGNGSTRNIYNLIGGTGDGGAINIYNNNTNTGNGIHYGVFTQLGGTGSGDHIGAFNNVITNSVNNDLTGVRNTVGGTSNNGIHIGLENNLTSNGTGAHTGVSNNLSAGSGGLIGSHTIISSSGNGGHYGNHVELTGTGSGSKRGLFAQISNSTGSSFVTGTYVSASSNGTGGVYGNYNAIGSGGTGTGTQTGVYNTISSSNNASHYGVNNWLGGTGSGQHYGLYNAITGSGTGSQYGVRTLINNSGNGMHIGASSELGGAGTGTKYGFRAEIPSSAGGTHYGLYSSAAKAGSFAGYFIGAVSIGTNSVNQYLMPPSRGTVDQVMQTDGSGNLSWVDPSALQDDDWTTVGANVERQSGDVYIGDTSGTNNDLYLSDRIIDWDNSNYFLDPASESRINEIEFDDGSAGDVSIRFTEQNTGFYSPFSDRVSYAVGGQTNMNWTNNANGIFRIEFVNNNDNILIGENTGNSLSNAVIDNIAIGNRALQSNVSGTGNVAIGERSLINTTGEYNTAVGSVSLGSLTAGIGNTALGGSALFTISTGSLNTGIGRSAGFNVTGSNNVFLGYQAGYNGTSRALSGSVFIGNQAGFGVTTSNRLYLDNSSTSSPLIYGEFDTNVLRTNGEFQIGNPSGTGYAFPTIDGTANQILQTDGAGSLTWSTSSAATTANNGLTLASNNVQLGGALTQATTISAGANNLIIDLDGVGDFFIHDNGLDIFEVDSGGISNFGDDVYWRDGNTAGTIIASIIDDGDDGVFRLYENGSTSVLMDANTQFIFNEQGLDRNFRIESDAYDDMFFLDAGLN
ncbi:MAG: hypothetical protein HKN48_06225, partial [Flavobacteriaceae bacterium]|nr:hypothetical protein [Flavobacteriaceae bacterium]